MLLLTAVVAVVFGFLGSFGAVAVYGENLKGTQGETGCRALRVRRASGAPTALPARTGSRVVPAGRGSRARTPRRPSRAPTTSAPPAAPDVRWRSSRTSRSCARRSGCPRRRSASPSDTGATRPASAAARWWSCPARAASADVPLELVLPAQRLVAERLVHADHVVVGLHVPRVDGLQCRLLVREPAHHVRLQQQPEPVPAVRAHHGGVVLVADPRPLGLHGHDRVPGQGAGLLVPGDHPVHPVAASSWARS